MGALPEKGESYEKCRTSADFISESQFEIIGLQAQSLSDSASTTANPVLDITASSSSARSTGVLTH
jgi:hypothetical protein